MLTERRCRKAHGTRGLGQLDVKACHPHPSSHWVIHPVSISRASTCGSVNTSAKLFTGPQGIAAASNFSSQ